VDTYDPKPLLAKLHGQHPPASFGNEDFQNGNSSNCHPRSKRSFKQYGQSGIEVSDLFPHTSSVSMTSLIVRSCYHEGFTHSQAQFLIHNGWARIGRPSLGPGFFTDSARRIRICRGLWCFSRRHPVGSGGLRPGLPAGRLSGTSFRPGRNPILNLSRPAGMQSEQQRDLLDTLRTMNEGHLESRNRDSELGRRIESYELAFRMQMSAPEATDISSESEATKKMYGLDNPVSADFGGRCLLARRMVERGVRFVQVWNGNGMNADDWDGHTQCDKNHLAEAAQTDKAVAGLLTDLKSRGLLDSTLVIWGGEFGRSPTSDGGAGGSDGRDHNPYGFTIWMAGGGVKGGKVIGSTDELGLRAVGDPVHLHDIHASILGLLGLDHLKLTYPYLGRNFRLTDVGGKTDLMDKLRKA
jgi:hypothetical protein